MDTSDTWYIFYRVM